MKIKVPQQVFRTATLTSEEGKTDALRVSISSDTPYLRYDYWNDVEYYEVLDHSPGGYEDGRLKAGLPILFNHQRNSHLGRALQAECDGKRLTVSDFKRSETGEAPARWKDVDNGSLADTSVGYSLLDNGKRIGEKDGIPILRFRWEPQEFSFVTIPADYSVGAGRQRDKAPEGPVKEISIETENNVDATLRNENNGSQQRQQSQNREKHQMAETTVTEPPQVDVVKERGDAVSKERERVKKINDYVGALTNTAWKAAAAAVAVKAIEGGEDFDDFRTKAINSFEGVSKAVETPDIGMTDKEVKRFSLIGAIRSMATTGRLDGFEKEACEAAQKQMRRELKDNRSFVIPEEVTRAHDEEIFRHKFLRFMSRAQNVGSAPAGGFTVETQYGSLIELLRNRTVLGQAGITIMDGLVGDFVMPVQTGGAAAYWVSETGTITDSEATFGQKSMVPHRLGASIPFTMQFIAQSSLSVDAFIRNELDIVMALKKDLAGLLGTGVGGEPLGVANTPGINATVTYSNAAAWADIVEHETGINVDNADIGSMAFILDSATVGRWKTILKDSVAGAGYLLSDGMSTNGYPAYRTNQTSAAHQSFFGVWSQLLLGMWAGREITVDNITLAKSGQHQIIMNELCDYLVRQPLAFNVSTDSAAQ